MEQLKTAEAKTVHRLIDIITELTKELADPFATELIVNLINQLKLICIRIDENPETNTKAKRFLKKLKLILENVKD